MDRQADFTAFVAEHEQQLRGTALLLSGDPTAADELVVTALARTHRRWRRLASPAEALTATRTALVAASLGPTDLPAVGTVGSVDDPADPPLEESDSRWLQALADLEPTTRAVVVLRLVEGQDEDDVATLLRCSPQAVADALADGVEALGDLLTDEPDPPPAEPPATTPVAGVWTSGGGDEVFRRPDTPTPPVRPVPAAAAPSASTTAAPSTGPTAEVADEGDPWAIYRRPT